MKFTAEEVMQYVHEEDVKFIRLAFCDVYGEQKNIAIMPGELLRAFQYGIAIDASAIAGFGGQVRSDLFLRPDPPPWSGFLASGDRQSGPHVLRYYLSGRKTA